MRAVQLNSFCLIKFLHPFNETDFLVKLMWVTVGKAGIQLVSIGVIPTTAPEHCGVITTAK